MCRKKEGKIAGDDKKRAKGKQKKEKV